MCKTGRKINKIIFNKFIWLYWKMKKINIYIYIFGGFPVARMRKKCVKKKKKRCRLLLGYCPFSACTGSRYNNLYRDIEAGKAGLGAARGPRHGQDSATSLRYDTVIKGPRSGRPASRASGPRVQRSGL